MRLTTKKRVNNFNFWRSLGLLILVVIICFLTARSFLSLHQEDLILPSSGLTHQFLLSNYLPNLANSPGDTRVYLFEGQEKGGNVLILGGTHPNEPAGFLAAVVLIENLKVNKGRIFLIPQANLSGFTHNDPFEANPQRFSLPARQGVRWFRYGSRLTNPVHQWPDPTTYTNPAGQKLAGTESRNLNRTYPGHPHGPLTERVAWAIIQLIKKENIHLAIDLHEAAPEYPVINAIVFHERAAELAAMALMDLQMEGFDFRLEASPSNLRGLSHREWGDNTSALAVLLETANASHGRLKGKPTVELIIEGKDPNYVRAAKLGRLFVPFDEHGIPLTHRVARHLAAVKTLLAYLGELSPSQSIEFSHFPSPQILLQDGFKPFLRALPEIK
ncbi:succinylglutamate desuccinylase/aspartoacylase family protein [Candidatus Aminicenantes bacterium AC-334-K16]|jgi:hypothetical protein|nr:succinylglutamate desuccinylase/aspartoacylase family protein [Candidatus Aminicenantes bacterium AC-334-K16]